MILEYIVAEKFTVDQSLILYLIEQINSNRILQGMTMLRQAVFLLSKEQVFTYDDFIAVRYGGVFSKNLQNDLDYLLHEGIIEKNVEAGPYTRMYSFTITKKNGKQPSVIGSASIDAFLNNLNKYSMSLNDNYELYSFEYYENISGKLNSDVKLLFEGTKSQNTNHSNTWDPSFLSSTDNKSYGVYNVSWFPLGPNHFKQIQKDIKRQAPCIFTQKAPQAGLKTSKSDQSNKFSKYSSNVLHFIGFTESQFVQIDGSHIEYVVRSSHGDIGIELHRSGTIICGINEQVLDAEVLEEFKNECNNHIFSIMSEIQIDMMIYSEGSGIQKTLQPPSNLFAFCENSYFDELPSKVKDYGEYRLKYVQSLLCVTTDAPHFVKSLMVHQNIIQSMDDIISELFNIIWIIWGYDLEKIDDQLLGCVSTKQLKLIQARTGKISKDFIDMNLLIEYLSDSIEKTTKDVYNLDESKLGYIDIIVNSKLLEWKIEDIRRISSASMEYHGKINELLNAKYDEIISDSELNRNNSLNVINFILFGVFAYPIIVDAMPKEGIATHIFLTISMCVLGYGIFKSSMYMYSKLK